MRTKDFIPRHKKQDLGNALLIFLVKLDNTLSRIQARRIFVNMYFKLRKQESESYFNDIKKHVEYESKKSVDK